MSTQLTYDTLAIEFGKVALERDQLRLEYITSVGETQSALEQRDTYRELCRELLSHLEKIKDIAMNGNATGSNKLAICNHAREAITKAEQLLGEKK